MAAAASLWLAIGLLLYLVGISVAGVALCRLAPRLGIEAEVEIKGPSFRLKMSTSPKEGCGVENGQASSGRAAARSSRQQRTSRTSRIPN